MNRVQSKLSTLSTCTKYFYGMKLFKEGGGIDNFVWYFLCCKILAGVNLAFLTENI